MKLDIVSDIVCPWCVVGYYQLAEAADRQGVTLDVTWHPFELTPDMGEGGKNLYGFLSKKFSQSIEEGNETRGHLTRLGADLGFTFNYTPDQIRYNTFRAHQLVHWAQTQGQDHALSLALFKANFTDHRNIDDPKTLADIASEAGLDREEALAVFSDDERAKTVRNEEQYWRAQGIQSVPSMIFERQFLVQGALGVERFSEMIGRLIGSTDP